MKGEKKKFWLSLGEAAALLLWAQGGAVFAQGFPFPPPQQGPPGPSSPGPPAYKPISPLPPPEAGPPVSAPSTRETEKGVVDPRTGEFYPGTFGGVVNPKTGAVLPKVEGGYRSPETGALVPGNRPAP